MQEQKVEQEIDITKLSNEFTYRKYMMSRDSVRHLFSKLSVAEYVALQSIEAISGDSAIYGGKAYLTVRPDADEHSQDIKDGKGSQRLRLCQMVT